MIQWLTQKQFWTTLDNATPPVMIDYRGWCYFHIPYSVLTQKIGEQEPNRDLSGEDDPPGQVSRWYAYLDDLPVILDFHHSHPHGEVVVIQHGMVNEARESVRKEFESWGERWLESPETEQADAGQPATRSVVEPEGGDKPKPETEGRSR